jgi:hypothetical protein
VGQLCVAEGAELRGLRAAATYLAPLVIDAGFDAAGASRAGVDATVLVAGPRTEPALARAVWDALARSGAEPVVALNRVGEPGRFGGLPAIALPDARSAARFALAGRRVPGPLGAAIGRLADRWAFS